MVGGGFGFLEGFAINPARDFGPRVAAYALGWGKAAFPGFHNYWWGPICGPFIGGPLGAFIYEAFNRPFMPGVQMHGDTPLMKAWSRLIIWLFPKLAVSQDDYGRTDKMNVILEDRFHSDYHHAMIDVGPGGTVPQESGIEGLDKSL
ncbi:Glycerol uptake facilitator protein [Galdieria sulphuraria]|nr:Glycerol uptake facilitator protein [Galdieria sulphuraria]